jgi:hypothetical protein
MTQTNREIAGSARFFSSLLGDKSRMVGNPEVILALLGGGHLDV